jgi:hypothetical protein
LLHQTYKNYETFKGILCLLNFIILMYIISTSMLLLLRAIILTFEKCKCLKKSSKTHSHVVANTMSQVLEHCTNAHEIKNTNSIPKISRWKIYIRIALYGKANSIVLQYCFLCFLCSCLNSNKVFSNISSEFFSVFSA